MEQETGWIIGSDESLKGDTFGGLVVAAVKADEKAREGLKAIGVADSKKLTEGQIFQKAELIREHHKFSVKSVFPEEYNSAPGLTQLMNRLHEAAAVDLGEGKHIVDKYPGGTVGDVQEEKAEDKYLEVAAASIVARAEALEQLKELCRRAGFTVPKGSTHVKDALQELKRRKLDPSKFVKLHFKNVKRELGL